MKENNVEASFDRPRNLHNDLIKHEQISNEQDEMSLALLPPDHPYYTQVSTIIERVSSHSKDQLMNEIEEIKYSVKQKEQQREEQGATLYDKQQEILRQNDKLEEYAQIQETVQQRYCEEEAVRHLKSREQRRKLELNLSQAQNQLAGILLEMERIKTNNYRIVQENEELSVQLESLEKKSDNFNAELKHLETQTEIK
ncbi:hypothetical protein EVAR_101424_1 [Eumeta japonica]|uniref:Uncharacterized protein n=1 Tax=Eumeta variegata TaxID=151549 RepID=A0A4C1TQJ2_EUMVA|nr:hypothetical protein EVAR_101424_1 [Eumeta japonica]